MLFQKSYNHFFNDAKLLFGFKGICSILSFLYIAAINNYVKAEILPDETLGSKSSVVINTPPNLKLIDGGVTLDSNLFHSFRKFNIDAEQEAFFINGNGIENIISRVTGNSRSEILGKLGVIGGNANLFLINPNGIIFGSNAQLDIGGSFVATTANAIEFEKQGFFNASVPDTPQLLTVKPSALLFNQIASQPITIQSTTGLQIPANQSFLLVGGDVNLEGGKLSVSGGQIELGGLAEIGTVGLNVDGSNLFLTFPDNVAKADVSLTNLATVNVNSQQSGGDIKVQGKRLVIKEGSQISSGTFNQESGGNLTVKTSDEVELSGTVILDGGQVSSGLFTQTEADGNAGNLTIETKRLIVRDGAQISTSTTGLGKAGTLNVNASESVQLIGTSTLAEDAIPSGLFAVTQGSSGSPGNLTVETRKLLVRDGAQVSTSTVGTGQDGGNLTVKAFESVQLIGTLSTNGQVRSRSGLLVGSTGTGNAGELQIETKKLLIRDGAFVSAGTLGEGKGGSVIINASDSVDITGTSENGSELSSITTETRGKGNAGNVTIETGQLSIKNGAQITSSSTGEGSAGNADITAKSINLDQGNIVLQAKSGDGGNVTITVKDLLQLRRNSQISATAGTDEAGGNGGNITINIPNGFIVALPKENSDITANAFTGAGGEVEINSLGVFGIEPRIQPTDKSDITASSELGIQGNINLNTPENNAIENAIIELPQNLIDSEALIATSCVVRSKERNGTFFITGKTNLPYSPQDTVASNYSAIKVQPLPDDTSAKKPRRRWKIGDPIVEPSGVYRLEDGRRLLSRECSK